MTDSDFDQLKLDCEEGILNRLIKWGKIDVKNLRTYVEDDYPHLRNDDFWRAVISNLEEKGLMKYRQQGGHSFAIYTGKDEQPVEYAQDDIEEESKKPSSKRKGIDHNSLANKLKLVIQQRGKINVGVARRMLRITPYSANIVDEILKNEPNIIIEGERRGANYVSLLIPEPEQKLKKYVELLTSKELGVGNLPNKHPELEMGRTIAYQASEKLFKDSTDKEVTTLNDGLKKLFGQDKQKIELDVFYIDFFNPIYFAVEARTVGTSKERRKKWAIDQGIYRGPESIIIKQ